MTLNDRDILKDAGNVSAQLAKSHAEQEFEIFRKREDRELESDFDRACKKQLKNRNEDEE